MTKNLLRCAFLLAWLMCAGWPPAAFAQAPAEISQAQQMLQAKDYDGAIKTLEEYFQRNPTATNATAR